MTHAGAWPPVQSLWRVFLRWRFALFHRRRHRRLVVEEILDRAFVVLPDVFNPKLFRTGAFLGESLDAGLIPPGSRILDMGTGSGVGAVFEATWASRVVAVDVNPAAVRCARINAILNRVDDRVEVAHGDLFAPVSGQRFDVVVFNPPFLPGSPRDDFERSLRGDGVAERFAVGLGDHLNPGGWALLVISTDGDGPLFLDALAGRGFRAEVVAERNLINETLTMHRVRRCKDAP